MPEERRDNEVVLPIGSHAFVLDTTAGTLKTYTGPTKITVQNTERTVLFDPNAASRFKEVSPSAAIQKNFVVPKGSYAVLKNPHKDGTFPRENKSDELAVGTLEIGRVVNIPGPITFAPWPGQEVSIVEGHNLKTNEYLVVRVYDQDEARKNWGKGEITRVDATKTDSTDPSAAPATPATQTTYLETDPNSLVIGQLILIKGDQISFYIPPTGIEVVKEGASFVRLAETLERLEYCLLVDQDGSKRYERGPQVVFPEPTETFKLNDDNQRRSRAYELNEISGVHIKIIQDIEPEPAPNGASKQDLEAAGFIVTEADGKLLVSNKEGDELFITGKVQAIYFPRVEHALLTYASGGDPTKRRSRHHAIQIGAGEARYLMNRLTGKIDTVRGETMLLPDPRTQVIVQRVLAPGECRRYYPGNEEALAYNVMLRQKSSDAESLAMFSSMVAGNVMESYTRTGHMDPDAALKSHSLAYAGAVSSRAGDTINRSPRFTEPRTLILDNKYAGAPKISPWSGYAVQTVDARGEREVVLGPQTINLDFDQHLEPLFLSTQTPKQHDKLAETVYLKIDNNVSDEFTVMTRDFVQMKIRLKYMIRFDAQHKTRWFNVDNYIQLLVDHFRSKISALIKKKNLPEFFLDASSILTEWVLGPEDEHGARPLKTFAENGMVVHDLEISPITIVDRDIADEMRKTQINALKAQFTIAQLDTDRELSEKREATTRAIDATVFETVQAKNGIAVKTVMIEHEKLSKTAELAVVRETEKLESQKKHVDMRLSIETVETSIALQQWEPDKQKEIHEASQEIERLLKEAQAMETRSKAIQPGLIEAFVALAQTGAFEVAAKHLGNLAVIQDMSIAGVAKQVFKGTQFENLVENLGKLGKGKLLEQPTAAS